MDTKALRQKILDLAIRGKLVPQDPDDEPASVLLERIREQKKQMVKEGKLKAKDIKNDSVIFKGEDNLHYEKFQDGTVKCIEDEIPFEVPEGWEWARLQSIAVIQSSKRVFEKDYVDDGIPFYRSKEIGDLSRNENIQSQLFITKDHYLELKTKYGIPKMGDILITSVGSIGNTWICDGRQFYYKDGNITQIVANSFLVSEYVQLFLKTDFFFEQVGKTVSGSAYNALTIEKLKNILFALPPYNEQHHIVDAFIPYNKLLEITESNREGLLHLINHAKNKILDLAIRGKLVPQDPNDEPASVLLERICAEKEDLIKQGKIKRDKKESVIFKGEDNSYYVRQDTHTEAIDEQFIFELPDNWEWCSLLNIAKMELGKTLDSAKNTGINYPYLRSVNVRWNDVDLSDLKEMRFEPEELERYTVRLNDLLICEGGDVGRSCVWTDDKEILYQNALHRVRFYGECNPFYFMYYMMYYESLGIIKALCKGVTIKHLTGNVLSLIPFALPPIKEQSRIVEKLNQIFTLIDGIISD